MTTSIHKFLNFNKRCPLCTNPLTLYMQWSSSDLYVSRDAEGGIYHFTKFELDSVKRSREIERKMEDENSMTLIDYADGFETTFGNVSLFHEAKKFHIYFYFLCREQGFKSRGLQDYQIDLAKGCYYRSTPIMEFVKNDKGIWELDYLIKESSDLVNKDESFCLKTRKDGLDKFYMLSRDMETQTTKAWYYAMTDEQRVDPKFKPNIWKQELPLIERPTMDNQKKILNKIQSWITLS